MPPVLRTVLEDEITVTTKRTIHEFTEISARISAWHGAQHVADFPGFTNLDAAIAEAQRLCVFYNLTPQSTMFLRIEIHEYRNYRTLIPDGHWPKYEQEAPRPNRNIMRRHAWDSRTGMLPADPATASIELSFPIGIPVDIDPRSNLTNLVTGIEATTFHPFLLKGIGIGEITITEISRHQISGPPAIIMNPPQNLNWAKLSVKAYMSLGIPPDTNPEHIQSALSTQVHFIPRIEFGNFFEVFNRLSIYNGLTDVRCTYPGAPATAA